MRPLILLFPLLLAAQPGRFGLPACSGPDLELTARHGFFLCYDFSHKLPRWSAHQILLSPATPRSRVPFRPDTSLARPTAARRDFAHSGFHRGHLVPAADLAASPAAYLDSFLLSNVFPQSPPLNNGLWRRVENAARRLARHADAVFVITGTFTPTGGHQRLGPGRVAIPACTFKVILVLSGGHKHMFAVLVPNHPAAASLSLSEVATTVDALEQTTGLDFFAALDDAEEALLESARAVLPAAAR